MGPVVCLLSATGFGLMAVFAKLAYDAGVELEALLLVRFGLAGAVLLAAARVCGRLRRMRRRTLISGLLMGAVGYAAQATLFFAALTRLDASLAALGLAVYPLFVMVGAVLTGRERASRRRAVALVTAVVGVSLVLGGAAGGGFDVMGAVLALGAAVVYASYILVGDRVAGEDPLTFAALVCCGAFVTFLASSLLQGTPDLGFPARGWLWAVMIALISTVAAILLFFAGLALVGPTLASLLSIVEPVVTVTAAALVFGETLSLQQVLGGLVVLLAVVIVQRPSRPAEPSTAGAGREAAAPAG